MLFVANYAAPAIILIILSLGLEIQWGQTGLFNAGVAAFMGIGAYSFGMLSTGLRPPDYTYLYPGHWGLATPQDLVVSAIVAMVVAGFFGVLIAIPTVKLRADYLAIATLGLAEIIRLIFKNAIHFTGGDLALDRIPRPFAAIIPGGWQSDGAFTLIVAAVLLGLLLIMDYMTRKPWGWSLKTVREDEEVAEALGKNTFVLKLGAFGLGCAIMGLAGALQASWLSVVLPDNFVPFITFTAYVIVIMGGSGNPRGVVVGGLLFSLFGWSVQQIKSLPNFPASLGPRIDFLNIAIIGVILVLLILFRPTGIFPEKKYVPKRRATE